MLRERGGGRGGRGGGRHSERKRKRKKQRDRKTEDGSWKDREQRIDGREREKRGWSEGKTEEDREKERWGDPEKEREAPTSTHTWPLMNPPFLPFPRGRGQADLAHPSLPAVGPGSPPTGVVMYGLAL